MTSKEADSTSSHEERNHEVTAPHTCHLTAWAQCLGERILRSLRVKLSVNNECSKHSYFHRVGIYNVVSHRQTHHHSDLNHAALDEDIPTQNGATEYRSTIAKPTKSWSTIRLPPLGSAQGSPSGRDGLILPQSAVPQDTKLPDFIATFPHLIVRQYSREEGTRLFGCSLNLTSTAMETWTGTWM